MAHQSKFVSVNLNKSYGQPPSLSSSSSAYGHGRARPGAAGVGSGMVVLSRPRSSGSAGQKGPPKLSVPPPLNLPSRRKEHERFDPSSAPGSSARPGSSGLGSGGSSSTMGWTKTGLFQDRDDGAPPSRSGDPRMDNTYKPPGARSGGQMPLASSPSPTVEKAVILRGEDFPTLRATAITGMKQKDTLNQKQKPKQLGEEVARGRTERPELQAPLDMRPQMRSSRLPTGAVSEKDEGSVRLSGSVEQPRKQDGFFPGPLPLVRLSHTSNWADDERDTGLSIPERERERDHGFSRIVSARDTEGASVMSKEFFRGDSFGRHLATPRKDVRDVSSWRTSQPRDGSGFPETGVNRDRNGGKPFGVNREMNKESNNSHLPHADTARDGFSNGGSFDTRYNRKDVGSGTSIQNGRNVADAFNGRVADQNQHRRYGDLSNNRYRGDAFQNSISKNPFSSGSKGFSLNDPILNFGREKRLISNSEKPYLENSVLDSSDPFSGGFIGEVNVKMFKRKKDTLKQADFIDPVRESFEAELERVQRMQEMERQRVMEEHARALELARREQEERERLAREEEERRRLLEEEAREAAWRAEQERMEAARRAEEQKIAREEERRRILMEEERRKEAARQKLLDLEARIAKRQAEVNLKDERFPSAVVDEQVSSPANGTDVPKAADLEEWEDGERMVEHITSMASSDSSSMNRYFDIGYVPHCSRDGNSPFMERGKNVNNWRRDAYDNGNSSMFLSQDQDSDYRNSRRDAFSSGRGFSRKEILGNIGPSVRLFSKGETSEALQVPDDLRHSRGSKWNIAVDSDYFNRNSEIDAEFLDNDKFGDAVWGPGRSRGSPHASYAERSYQNSEADGFSSFGRSRHSLRQPRVFPPPSMSSMRKSPFGTATEHPSSSSFLDSEMRYQHAGKAEEGSYNRAYQERLEQPGTTALAENTIPSEQIENKNSLRCDSQSSLSVSSPPTSPTHLSHDDLDESEDSQAPSTSAVGEQIVLSDNEHIVSALEAEDTNIVPTSTSVSHGEDDEWPTEKHETMQEQEEYDEDDDGYREEEEAHEGNGENLDPDQEFEDVQSDVPAKSGEADQIVLGFDEGVELQIPINDEFETTPRNSEETIGFKAGSIGATEELICSEGDMVESDNAFPGGIVNDSSNIINETEKALQDLTLDPVPSTSYNPDSVEATSSGMLAQEPVSSTLSSSMSSTCLVQPILSSVSTVASQPEVPIKLHFGLFSGPSLIPSPVPAIQIGSIQMPLHLHPQVGPSMTQMHSSQPPFFQFGQLRYPSPISQGILPLAPQTMSFVQPPASAQYSLNQNLGGSAHNQASQESSSLNNSGDKVVSAPSLIDNQPGLVTRPFDVSQDNIESRRMNALPDSLKNEVASRSQTGGSSFVEVKSKYVSASQSERHGIRDVTVKKNYRPVANNKESPLHAEHNLSQFFSGEKVINESRAAGMVSGSRGKRFAYTVRNAGSRPSFSATEASHTDSGGFQRRARRNIRRTEFRVRENADRRQIETAVSFNNAGQDGKPNFIVKVSGNSARYGGKKDTGLNQSTKTAIEPEKLNSGASIGRAVISGGKKDRVSGKDSSSKKRISSLENYHSAEGNTKRNGSSEEDVDAPLQSGVVRVFKQPGIEAPSDEDDFIQVRSKRQMLNDRREQREKEIKAKSRVMKAPRKPRAVHQSNAVTSKLNKTVGGDATNIVHPGSGSGRAIANVESSPIFTANITSPSLPPIGTPAVNVDSDPKSSNSLKSCQKNSMPPISSVGTNLIPVLSLDNKNGVSDDTSMPFGSWCNADINQQVMALTQSQLDEAMQPARFDSHATSSIAHEPIKPSTSITMQEKSFSSSASSLNSLLAGEKIQFGAVTSPTVLPPVSRTSSNGIGPPGSGRSDVAMASKLPATENDCAVFFDKDKHPDETCAHLEDPEAEAEAEAAASAVAVAAISNNDEIVGNRLSACSVSISDTNNFSGSDATLLTLKGVAPSQEVTGQLAVEESLTVSLPADLSVDTPSLPLWPPLPNPQTSSSPMLSHFPAAPPSHFPCFEMNPMLGGPIFAFGPHDESAGTQGQQQRSTTIGSGPLGAWPQWHSTMDSFYGPPTGFTGPFISPGGIPGVQGPPHMVVYNHFAPVGQFGQVGLSFMGTTYIPTGKQPDWKHNPASSAVGVSESDMSNLNVVSGSHNPPSMPTPIQHMAPGSSLMPMASPLTMFDMSFQSSADIPLQAHWSHIPAPPIHSVPLSVPLQQHQADRMPSQFNRGQPLDPSAGNNRFNERLSTVADGNRSLSIQKDAAPQFLHDLGLVEPPPLPSPSTDSVKTIGPSSGPASGNDSKGSKCSKSSTSAVVNASESGGNGISSSNSEGQSGGPSSKHLTQQQWVSSGQQYLHPIGHADQRGGGTSQKIVSGGEWHRRMGYQGRNQTSGADKNFALSKVKQIYVAKLPTSGPAATG